jgi:hypothetical protein
MIYGCIYFTPRQPTFNIAIFGNLHRHLQGGNLYDLSTMLLTVAISSILYDTERCSRCINTEAPFQFSQFTLCHPFCPSTHSLSPPPPTHTTQRTVPPELCNVPLMPNTLAQGGGGYCKHSCFKGPGSREQAAWLPFRTPRGVAQSTRMTTLHPSAPASRMAQARQPRLRREISAFQPLSAHSALTRISMSLPNCRLLVSECMFCSVVPLAPFSRSRSLFLPFRSGDDP